MVGGALGSCCSGLFELTEVNNQRRFENKLEQE